MNRREWIGLGASLATANLARAYAATGRIRIAFLGGSHSHAQAKAVICRDSADWDLAGVWEDDSKLRDAYTKAGIRLISRAEALDSSVRVVAVEGPVKQHYEHALAALKAGKHVHVEKPPADTLAGMRDLVRVAQEKKLFLQSGYMWRYHPGFNKILEAVRNGWLGDVYMIRAQMNTLIEAERRPEWAEFAGGQMFEQGAHLIDAVVRVMGGAAPLKVSSFLRKHGAAYRDTLKDNTVAVLEYPHALAVIQSSTLQPGAGAHRAFEVLGANGAAVLRPIEPGSLTIDLAKPAGPYQKGPQSVPLPKYTRYMDDLAELAAAVRGEKSLTVPLEQELIVQQVLLSASEMK